LIKYTINVICPLLPYLPQHYLGENKREGKKMEKEIKKKTKRG
jgi:hypothetical protein